MSRDHFRVLVFDLSTGRGKIEEFDGRNRYAGGSGLAALLFSKFGRVDQPWDDPGQPFILAIGPLTGYFPLMSKVVSAFKSPYHDQYTESHGGGRAALALFFANLDALVIVGRASRLSCLCFGSDHMELKDVSFLKGKDVVETGKIMRKIFPEHSGHRSLIRVGPAGEQGFAMACINVDTYRHFGRLGGGAVMGCKNLKGIVIQGDCHFTAETSRGYSSLYKKIYTDVTATKMMKKYHDLGTAANIERLNDIHSLPWNNLQKTADDEVEKVSGKAFAEQTMLRNGACSGCPVGCIHIGYVREKAKDEHRYHYHQVPYDYELVFAAGTMLGVKSTFDVLRILEVIELGCIDGMSGGVALAWATEALERGLVSERETLVPLKFGNSREYEEAAWHLCRGTNEFYSLLCQGTLKAAERYGGGEFACVLGQEMAGYATGELFFAAQSLGFRHSHLDTGAYSWDQKNSEKNVEKAVKFLVEDEPGRVFLTSMVACLFARSVYTKERLAECLDVLGYSGLASRMDSVSEHIRKVRWKTRIDTGYKPEDFEIPKRFYSVKTWKGPVDKTYLEQLRREYGRAIMRLAEENEAG